MKKKILWISHFIPYPPKGGARQRSFGLLQQAIRSFEVYFIGIDYEANLDDAELLSFTKRFKYAKIIKYKKNKIEKFATFIKSLVSINSYTFTWLFKKSILYEIIELQKVENFDLIHFDSIDVAKYYTKMESTKTVLNHHNYESGMMSTRAQKEKNIVKKIFFFYESLKLRNDEKKYCKIFSQNIMVSELDKSNFIKSTSITNINVITNGVDLKYFSPKRINIDKTNTLIFAGGLSWYPNRDAMLHFVKDIIPYLNEIAVNYKVDIIGANPPPKLIKLSHKYKNIKIHGFVDDVRPFMNNASIYVCPIRDGGGTKLKVLDALAMGLPLIAYKEAVEGIELISGEHFLLARNAYEFAEKIAYLINNSDLRKSIAAKGRTFIEENYSFEAIGEKLINIYNNVIDN